MEERIRISERVENIIEEYVAKGDFAHQTLSFVRKVLAPESAGEVRVAGNELKRYDMQYRYDHTLRVAEIGRKIAREEGLSEEALVMGCLLHDVGYPECGSFEELGKHSAYGAEIAKRFLGKIGYDRAMSESICKAVLIHDRSPYEGEDATVFEKSVRDADDIDRADAMRICIQVYHDIGECPAWETKELCVKRLAEIKDLKGRICGTKTAKCLWLENLHLREEFYQRLLSQMERTREW
ncbi:MAG: HD domain-containing protein [Lachnospiraceae bacterium]|nr:HD domain-containing protein [Lachnospiraceae bacterium]